ncbi:MAG: heat-inducible transcriptional repressor HrcA [Oscillospiraceae bacterium]
MAETQLTQRQKEILSAIVEEYIETGSPVGSKSIMDKLARRVSSATIRSDMVQLYELGYLEQPHTSAGRIPTHLGFREYINDLMQCQPLTKEEQAEISSLFNVRNPDPDKLLGEAADALSDYTGYASVTSSIVPKSVSVKRIEIIAAGDSTVVLVLVASNGVIRSKVCRVDFYTTPELIAFFYKFANARFAGRSIESITSAYISSVSLRLGEHTRIFTTMLLAIYELCKEVADGAYYISGTTKLLDYSDELGRLARDLLGMFEDRASMHKLFGDDMADFKVLIGKENALMELTGSSVMVTTYQVGGKPAGTVGLIGPVRLNYAKVIPHLEYFAKTLGELMNEMLEPEDQG